MKKIAFLILAHSDPKHFFKLINSLGKNCDIYVYIDKKVNILDFTPKIKLSNLFYIQNRINISWAGISVVDAQMRLMAEMLKNKEKYTHAVFLSGSDYPIKNMTEIYYYFSSQENKEFIKFIDMRESPEHYMNHINYKWFKEPYFDFKNNNFNLIDKGIRSFLNKLKIRNKWSSGMIPYFGSNWCALTMNCCQYVYDYHSQNEFFRKMNRFSMSPDEHYIHTIVGNSYYKMNSFGVQAFEGRGTYRMANFHIIDKSLSKWFTIYDWEEIIKSDKLFVRKVRSYDGIDLVNKINEELLNISNNTVKNNCLNQSKV